MAKKTQTTSKFAPKAIPDGQSQLKLQTIFIVILGLALYSWTLTFDYALDDTLMITGNKYTQQGFDGIPDIFSTDAFEGFFGGKGQVAGGRYRPFTHFIFAVEVELFGFSPFVGHLFNVVTYIALLLVLFSFLRRLFPALSGTKEKFLSVPFVITALFAAHPLHTEAVANIKGCDEIVTMLSAIGAMVLLYDYITKPKIWRLIAAFVLYFIALLSKENAITWIAVFPFILWIFSDAKKKDYFTTMSVLLIPAALFMFIRAQVVGGILETEIAPELLNNPFIYSTKMQEIATVVFTWLIYFRLILFPHPLTHDYYPKQIAITDFSNPVVWITIAIVIFSIIIFFRGLKKKSPVSIGILIFWATFSIASNLLFNIGTFMNERFMFVPLLGIAIIAGCYFGKYYPRVKWLGIAFWILIGLYSAKTISRSLVWKNNKTLFLTDVKTSSKSAKVNVSAAEVLLQEADAEKNMPKRQALANEALTYLNRAQKIHPVYFGVYDLRGKANYMVGQFKESLEDYKTCVSLDNSKKTIFNNIYLVGLGAIQNKNFTVAIDAFRFLVPYEPDSARNWLQMAIVYDQLGMMNECFRCIDSALTVDSLYAPAWNKGGELFGRVRNDFATSEKYLLKSYSIDPNNASVLENLGVLYGIMKQYQQSVHFLLKAHTKSPENKQILINLGTSYSGLGKKDSAEYYLRMGGVMQ
ncbi:MAG TPA: tetratricopeptide repeat protein [Bacteroidales bacterium]|nr:tetratricopeptide repeat protein [Bacteroidales bacterium]